LDSSAEAAASLERLKSRIEALRAKTVDNGCTESEALAAAEKVAELLDRHNLSLSDVEIRSSECDRRTVETSRKTKAPLDYTIAAIADFCDCKVWRETAADGERRYVFFGLRHDADAANNLAQMISSAIGSSVVRYRLTRDYQALHRRDRATATASFGIGMAISISEKLREMKKVRDQKVAAAGRDLVVVKAAVVDRELERLNMKFREPARSGRRYISEHAFNAGQIEGQNLPLNPSLKK
jgi:hypothetical protein